MSRQYPLLLALLAPTLIVLTADAPSSSAAPVPVHLMPKGPLPYFPTTVGAEWVYEQKEYEMKLVVTKVEATDEGMLVTVENVVAAGKTIPIHKVLVSRAGLAMTEEAGEAYAPHWGLLKLPHRAFDQWETTAKRVVAAGPFNLTLKGEMTDRGEEDVRVPAGKFRALRVDADVSTNGGNKERMSRWFAPGVGIVKEEWPHTVRELKSFSPTGARSPK